ncbi:MAG: hypothetical protein Kow0098_17290 [Ignavibacteriaceae bacterium]
MRLNIVLALAVFTLLLLLNPVFAQDMNPEAGKLFNEGNSQLEAGNYSGAIKNYQDALKIEQDYRIYYQLGIAQKKSGELEAAKNSFESCLKLKNDFEAGYNALGGVYYTMGNLAEAINNFKKVLQFADNEKTKSKVKKNLALAYTKMGKDELNKGNVNDAISYFTQAVNNYNYDAAYLSLAQIYSDLGQWDQSISAAENALKYRSSVPKGGPYYYMGLAYKGKGDIQKAKEMFNQAKSDGTYKSSAEYELSQLN